MAVKSHVLIHPQYGIPSLYNRSNYIAKIHLYGLTQTKNYVTANVVSVISVFGLCSDTPILIDSFLARIVRVATMCN